MTPERWEEITKIYHIALLLDSDERSDFLEQVGAEDESLRREVESLLEADAEATNFIAHPVLKDVAAMLPTKCEPSLIGQNLGHYRIISRLGAGGMGEVYLAEDSKLGRQVALKVLPSEFCDDGAILQRFKTEARAAATLNHPCIATLYSVEEIDDCYFITLEYVKGKTLADLIPTGGLDLKIFLEWFVSIADALAHSHERGIVHRDIKPGNVMITTEGVPKILDFGIAQIDVGKTTHSATTLKLTQPGQVFGTPLYMSPEQAEARAVDHRSDIFSFGVLMYEAITGVRPFKGDSYASIVSDLLKAEPPPVTELKPATPFLLARLITRCLSKSRQKRPQSMREVRAILEETKALIEAGASMDSFAKRLLPKPEKPRLRIFAALGLFIVAFSVFAFYYFRPNPTAPINFANMTLRKLSQTSNVVYAGITPDGKSIAYNTIEENENRSLWIRRVEDKNALQLVAPQPVYFWGGLTISPDGSQIFYITANREARHGTLYRVSSLGGAPRKLVETVNDLGSLTPDGSRVVYVRYGEKMQILSANAADGSDERVIQTGETNHIFRDPQFSLDGKKIYFIKFENRSGEEFWSLAEIPATGGREKIILPPRKPKISEIAVLKDGSGLLVNATDAFSNLQQLFHVGLPDGKETRLTNDLNFYFGISASDDGKRIVAAQRNFARDIRISSGAEIRKLTTESNIYTTAVFTPDGRIVYDAADNNRPHIWIMNGDGTNAQQLTPNDSFDFEPRVSPDGRYIFFTSERTGEKKVWRMNVDGSNPQLLTPVGGATRGPVVMPDGRAVLFRWDKDNKKTLGKIPVTDGEITEQPLFGDHLWAISPDSGQVAFVFRDEQTKQNKVRIRPLEIDTPSTVLDISPTDVLLWTADGKNLLYRDIKPGNDSASTLWMQPVSGGKPKSFLSVKPDAIFFAAQSNDGKQTLVVCGNLFTDAVMLTKIEPN